MDDDKSLAMKNLAYDVDGSEIPFPTTWHGAETFKIYMG